MQKLWIRLLVVLKKLSHFVTCFCSKAGLYLMVAYLLYLLNCWFRDIFESCYRRKIFFIFAWLP